MHHPDPDFEATRYRLLIAHANRLAELYRATRLPAALALRSTRPGHELLANTAASLGSILIHHIEVEHDHAQDVLYGTADASAEDRQVSRSNVWHHVVEQVEALVADVDADTERDAGGV